MATTKPTKPSITLPPAFGTSPSNVKTPYTAQELVDGYSASIQQILDGGNVNWLNDTFFKFLTYTTAICDWLNNAPVKKIPFINSSNQLDYMDAPAGNIIGTILAINCTASYVPDGCLPCDGSEYTKAQFSDLWTNFLTSNPAKLNVCTYEQYQSDISIYGQCGKFAVDTTNQKFKVPTLPNKLITGQVQNVPVITKNNLVNSGNETGLTWTNLLDNTQYIGDGGANGLRVLGVAPNGFTSRAGGYAFANQTADGNLAPRNLVADTSNSLTSVELRFFVVVSNGQINQSQMDWSQWASSLSMKANVDLSNISNIAQSFINTVLTWGMPDYSAGVSVAYNAFQGSGWTAPSTGIIIGSANWGSANNYVIVNGGNTVCGNSETSEFFLPVTKGDVVTQTNSSVIESSFTHLTFYPLKGVSQSNGGGSVSTEPLYRCYTGDIVKYVYINPNDTTKAYLYNKDANSAASSSSELVEYSSGGYQYSVASVSEDTLVLNLTILSPPADPYTFTRDREHDLYT